LLAAIAFALAGRAGARFARRGPSRSAAPPWCG
jgi:hypothetical protein